jgi:hypothetical protein
VNHHCNQNLDNNTKHPEVLWCFDLMEGVIDEKIYIFFTVESNLFTFGTITLLKPKIISVAIFDAKVST